MANNKSVQTLVSLLLMSSLTSFGLAEVVEKSLLQAVGTNNQRLGRAGMCLADLYDDTEIKTKTLQVIEGGIGFLKQYLGKTLTNEGYMNLSNLVIMTAVTNMQGITEKCATAADAYSPSNTPVVGADLSKTGRVFVRIGDLVQCIVQKGDSAALEKIPIYYAKIIEGLASDADSNLVDVLFHHETVLANDLASVTSECRF